MSTRRARCVLCRKGLNPMYADRTDHGGHPAYDQHCPSCGGFVMEAPAIDILSGAVADGVRTRKCIVDHFGQLIAVENRNINPAIITTDDAQAYCYGPSRHDTAVEAN